MSVIASHQLRKGEVVWGLSKSRARVTPTWNGDPIPRDLVGSVRPCVFYDVKVLQDNPPKFKREYHLGWAYIRDEARLPISFQIEQFYPDSKISIRDTDPLAIIVDKRNNPHVKYYGHLRIGL